LQAALPFCTAIPVHPAIAVLPLLKSTVPPGVPLPGLTTVTAAVNVTGWPAGAVFDVSATLVAAFPTTMLRAVVVADW